MSDNGFLNYLATASSGAQFENAVFTQLRQRGEVRYFALKTGREIDFVFDGVAGVEVKETPTLSDRTALETLATRAGLKQSTLVGRYPVPAFTGYLWGGDLR